MTDPNTPDATPPANQGGAQPTLLLGLLLDHCRGRGIRTRVEVLSGRQPQPRRAAVDEGDRDWLLVVVHVVQ